MSSSIFGSSILSVIVMVSSSSEVQMANNSSFLLPPKAKLVRRETESRYIYKEKLVTDLMLGTKEEGVWSDCQGFQLCSQQMMRPLPRRRTPRAGGQLQGKYCTQSQKCKIHNTDASCSNHLDSDPWVFIDQCDIYITIILELEGPKVYQTLIYGKGSLSGDRTVKSPTPRTNFLIQGFV